MLRVGETQFMRSSRNQIAEVMQAPRKDPVARGQPATLWTRQVRIIPLLQDNFGPRQIFDPLEGNIGPVFAWPQFGRGGSFGSFHDYQVYSQSSVLSPLPGRGATVSEKQAIHYSGKKKAHSDKNMVVVNKQTKRVSFLSQTLPGSVHDKKAADQAAIRYPRNTTLRSDLGLLGYAPEVREHLQPKKNQRTRS
jgi:hypothetical protein